MGDYQVLFSGEVTQHANPDAVRDNLARELGIADRKARAAANQVESEAPDDMSEEDLRAEKKERAQKCEQYRAQLEAFLRSTRLYQEDGAGDRTYLSDDEVMAARSRVEGQIQEYCGS